MHGNGAHYTYVKHVLNCTNDVYYEGVRNVDTVAEFCDLVLKYIRI